ncbi:DegT/DnrJ/EryC1/StrS family aminotransferase [Hoeflea prorocentri]|uniref:DegT/DnrJ/EryC1/StrS family aminotransferase n=1 Tax=Hoeflea prorocentri TaxID=1922333 RepID=A0A9X3UKY5_9HYPH|nr:DegT/DnrJ/EryC1/StrS family aminotransferase [Hoeflea prorocentri]MCY6382325.1 DegT/DnrJ/EryC1/StrS family aminotransferase [Hoeflea prorocentri]MDA5400125.1 DegT/DnrJ/EryC1/StrS family aminotransferase [Hoeflea prorocentri]
MYIVGEEEAQALQRVIRERALFRYGFGKECDRFEQRYGEHLNVKHVALTVSGTFALSAALTAIGIGPGDEVLVPAHTYMATATSVLTTGAIPVIVDIDESLTISPRAIEGAIGPQTKAVIAVHMWGAACDMDAIMEIAAKHDLLVVEDACQGVGGSYRGKKFGSIGHIGAFSFNYHKNMTCGEGGAVATSNDIYAGRTRCAIDPCHYYWKGRPDGVDLFAGNGGRASELQGAMLNVQLDRIDGIVAAMRDERRRILDIIASNTISGLFCAPMHSPELDCGAHLMFQLPTSEAAERFSQIMPVVIAGKTGRHTYTQWDQILMEKGAAHHLMNPYEHPANAACRRHTAVDQCPSSLDILMRTIMVPMRPEHQADDIAAIAHNILETAKVVLEGKPADEISLMRAAAIDESKFDMADDR